MTMIKITLTEEEYKKWYDNLDNVAEEFYRNKLIPVIFLYDVNPFIGYDKNGRVKRWFFKAGKRYYVPREVYEFVKKKKWIRERKN